MDNFWLALVLVCDLLLTWGWSSHTSRELERLRDRLRALEEGRQ